MATRQNSSPKRPGTSSRKKPRPTERKPRIGLALGGGGAKGLAHIPMLEALDELGLKPHRLAGVSIGAIFAAAYASGVSARDIHQQTDQLIGSRRDVLRHLFRRNKPYRALDIFDPKPRTPSIFRGEKLLEILFQEIEADTFEELGIPLQVVAADFWNRQQVVIQEGSLRRAITASMALPGLFTPQAVDGRILIDGGAVNPCPYDLLLKECDITVAIDVSGAKEPGKRAMPTAFEAVFTTFQIMQRSILEAKLAHRPPTIFIRPEVKGVRMLDFLRSAEVYEQAAPAKEQLKRALEAALPTLSQT